MSLVSHAPVIDDAPGQKRRKTPAKLRKQQILALSAVGLTQTEIGAKLGVSRRSISRDLEDLKPSQQQVESLLSTINNELSELQKPRAIAENYVNLATKAVNESVRLGSQDRILELRGVISDRERLRIEKQQPQAPAPMFVFNGGLNIDFGGSRTQSQHDTSVSDIAVSDIASDDTSTGGPTPPPR